MSADQCHHVSTHVINSYSSGLFKDIIPFPIERKAVWTMRRVMAGNLLGGTFIADEPARIYASACTAGCHLKEPEVRAHCTE